MGGSELENNVDSIAGFFSLPLNFMNWGLPDL